MPVGINLGSLMKHKRIVNKVEHHKDKLRKAMKKHGMGDHGEERHMEHERPMSYSHHEPEHERHSEKKMHPKKKEHHSKHEGKMGIVMSEFKHGKLHSSSKKGPKVKSRAQAIAIGLSEARKAGEHVKPMKKK